MSAKRERAQVGAHVEIEPGKWEINVWQFEIKDGQTYEQVYVRKLEAWANEIKEFFRSGPNPPADEAVEVKP